ncbi:MAG: hypothetical protein AUI14_16725 [Actinobacteria bacterium 13_2_20CM_2_71_6]|nr:MAG: hypothetical protein AUI14_16725 [Actinobacteria bacterium 13_2_20CM_2_71_6]
MQLAEEPEVELSDDPFEDDLTEQLAARAPRRLANRTTVVLAGLVLVIGGFVAGAQVEKHFGHVGTANATPTTFPTGGRGGFGGGGGGGGGNPAAAGASTAPATTGTVKFVDGTTIYITTADGNVVTVKTDGNTAILQPGSVKDLAIGAQVTVQGQAGSDGTVSATRITRGR